MKMNFLTQERHTLAQFLPTLDEKLREGPLLALERPGNAAIALYRECKGPGLLISVEDGGLGANPVQAIQIHRAIASRSPSLAVAVTMHNFSVATLVEYTFYGDYSRRFLREIAAQQHLLASGFAEGRTNSSILIPTMWAKPVEGGYLISGSKKPCSLSNSMHLLIASVAVPKPESNNCRRAVAIIPAGSPGIERKAFWKNWVLAGAESDELTLTEVFIPDEYVFFPDDDAGLDLVETGGFLWFELLISASYLGIASALVEQALMAGKGGSNEQTLLAIELEGAMAALEGIAYAMMSGHRTEALLARCLFVRFAVQSAIDRSVARAVELLGGMAFIGSCDVSYLSAASRALAFHPPSRLSISPALASYLIGEPFRMA